MNLYGPKQLADSMRKVRKRRNEIGEEIAENKYSYRPTPESRSVTETLLHIASLAQFDRLIHEQEHLASLESPEFGALIQKAELEEKRPRSKAEIIDLLRTDGERWSQWVEQLPESLLSDQVLFPRGASTNRFQILH